MNRGVDYLQGRSHAAQMFEGNILDATGALVIVSNIELSAAHQPPQYAQGMRDLAARVRRELERNGVKHG